MAKPWPVLQEMDFCCSVEDLEFQTNILTNPWAVGTSSGLWFPTETLKEAVHD